MRVLKEKFYGRETLMVAEELLGKFLVRNIDGVLVGGKIVETEGYLGIDDKGCHAYGGKKTPKIMPLYGKPGTAYIYSIYGMYYCLNAIAEKEEVPEGVLIRAIEPLFGLDVMAQKRNKKSYEELSKKEILNLTSGPSKLCMALDIDKKLNNTFLWEGNMYILERNHKLENLFETKEMPCGNVIKTKRIGIDYAEEAKDFPYRFYYEKNPYVSKKG